MAAPVQDLFFEELVTSYVASEGYLERSWLEERLHTRLEQPQTRYVLITGPPGAGKSGFVAGLAGRNKRWLRYFIRRDQRLPLGGTGARAFLLQIGCQFAALYPQAFERRDLELRIRNRVNRIVAGGRVVGAKVEQLIASPFFKTVMDISLQVQENKGDVTGLQVERWITDPYLLPVEELAYMGLLDPAARLFEIQPDTAIVILVDALDELRFRPETDGLLEWLETCPDLPPNCKFVLTSREDRALLARLRSRGSGLVELEIASDDLRVQEDAAEYARFLTEPDEVKTVLGSPQAIEEFVQQAVFRSKGNLGYLDTYRRAIRHAIQKNDPAQLTRLLNYSLLPTGLTGLYAFLLNLIRGSVEKLSVEISDPRTGERLYLRAWPAIYQKILAVLAVAFEPLSADQIARLGSISADRSDIQEALLDLSQLLEGRAYYRLYLTSLAEFLRDPVTAAEPDTTVFAVRASEYHTQIVSALIRMVQGDWSDCDTYGLQYLLQHLLEADLEPDELNHRLDEILTEPFIQARGERFGWHRPLIQDLERLKHVAPMKVMQTGTKVITGGHRNSLVNREVLRLLRSVYSALSPDSKSILRAVKSTHDRQVYDLVAILERSPEEAMNAICSYLEPERPMDVRIKGLAVLAVAETRAADASQILQEVLLHPGRYVKRSRDSSHVRWCAADGLLALRDATRVPDLQSAFWTPAARPWDRHIILYVLGRMKADLPASEVKRMIDVGLENPQPFLPRVIDAISLLAPQSGKAREDWVRHYQDRLLTGLGLADPSTPPQWENLLVVKRAIVVLGRIGTIDAADPLKTFLEGLASWDLPETKKANLLDAGRRAFDELVARHRLMENAPVQLKEIQRPI